MSDTQNPAMRVAEHGAAMRRAEELNELGVAALNANQPRQALELFQRAALLDPGDARLYNNRGLAHFQLRGYQAALESYERAIALNDSYAGAYSNRGSALLNLRRHEAALESFDTAIALKPDFGEAHHNRGCALLALQRYRAALESFELAIALNVPHAHKTRGNALVALGRFEEAVASFDRALALLPQDAEAHYHRGNARREMRRYQEALADYDAAAALDPNHADALNNLGAMLQLLQQPEAALLCFERAIEVKAEYAEAHANRGAVLTELKRFAAARASLERAIALDAACVHAHKHLGNLLLKLGELEAALASYERAIALQPDDALARSSRGVVLVQLQRMAAALGSFDQAIALMPDCAHAHFSKALALLLDGDLQQGWIEHEWRYQPGSGSSASARICAQPRWLGEESLAGKTILLYGEQGLGDTVQFCRYVRRVADLGATVILEVQPLLATLLAQLDGVSQVVCAGGALPAFDYHSPLIALPRVFRTGFDTIPSAQKYLSAEPARVAQWQRRLGNPTRPRIGLAWSGNVAHSNDANRSIPLTALLAKLPQAFEYVSLQPEVRDTDRQALATQSGGKPMIADLTHELGDFSDTAALCECLDLVISVDTSVAHLNAALGRDTWILLPHTPDWRWLLKRTDSPWYPSVALYRQETRGDWHGVLERVAADLVRRFAAAGTPAGAGSREIAEANALYDAGDWAAAEHICRQVLSEQAEQFDALNLLGIIAAQTQRQEEAALHFARAAAVRPEDPDAHNNCGNVLGGLRRFEESLRSFDRALQANPRFAPAHLNRGNVLRELRRFDDALASYRRALEIRPDYGEAWNNLGVILQQMNWLEQAGASFERALAIKPDYPWLAGTLLQAKLELCDWRGLEPQIAQLAAQIRRGRKVTPPFPVVALTDSLELQREAAATWVRETCPSGAALRSPRHARHGRIRVGYYSADFHGHATGSLAAELFEKHDRAHFEVTAFSFGPQIDDEMHRRLITAFERFVDVRTKSDREVAQLSRELEIDIAVDLKGFTEGRRTGILAERAAPVQVSFLGYPATMSAPFIDYIIADRAVIPEPSREQYVEKVVYLPDSYQVNDSQRQVSCREFDRIELGLPPSGFVFCCFNSAYKITPGVFDSWMRILRGVAGSVLWLFKQNETSAANLRREAEARGVHATRLIFAGSLPRAEHLARYRAADLFIDTLPYNAHTTASDALWSGVPVLTRAGESFAARVGASLLTALDLPDLITTSAREYEALAIELANDPQRLAALRARLSRNRSTSPLFDGGLFARHLEDAYRQMYERCQADLAPEHLQVARWAPP